MSEYQSIYEKMCNKNVKSRSLIKNQVRPARKTRTKTRKPKFLSLRLDIPPGNAQPSGQMTLHHHNQLNLFPLHPGNVVEDKYNPEENNIDYFFDPDGCGGATLTDLLDVKTEACSDEDKDSMSPSPTYAYGGNDSDEYYNSAGSSLVRTALRCKERDASDERWVCYSEVVEKKEEEVTSCAADVGYKSNHNQRLSLKLDYEEILNAWSDKGPLYIDGECPQTVPELSDNCLLQDGSTVLMDDLGSGGNAVAVWSVPEMRGNVNNSLKHGQREASVMRYKEKRQTRLYSKRIRYEVRKLNAEKRPRMKGRFVKRS